MIRGQTPKLKDEFQSVPESYFQLHPELKPLLTGPLHIRTVSAFEVESREQGRFGSPYQT